MNRQLRIKVRTKWIDRLFIGLAVIIMISITVREYSLFLDNIHFFNTQLYENEREVIKQEVEARIDEIESVKADTQTLMLEELEQVVTEVDFFSTQSLQCLDGTSTLEEKRNTYIDSMYQFDVSEDEYLFFAIDLSGLSYLSGLTKSLEGTDISNLQDAVTGNYFIQDMIDIILESPDGSGYISYYYPKEVGGEHLLKTSYIYYNEEVELIVGTGVYYVDYTQMVQEELFNRISTYTEESERYVYIMSFDGDVIYHPSENFTKDDLLAIETLDGGYFHQTIVDTLQTQDSLFIEYYFDFAEPGQIKTGYVVKIDEWDMYLGRSFINNNLQIESDNYFNSVLPNFIAFNATIILVVVAIVIVVKKFINDNIVDIQDEFDHKNMLIQKATFVDKLTNLNNRSFFETILEKLPQCKRGVGVVMIDANGLKLINDAYGHQEGDHLLKKLASLIQEVYQDNYVFRWGGDEFLVVISKTTEEMMNQKYQQLNTKMAQIKIKNVPLSAALGYYVGTMEDENIYEMISKAEKIMYDHKSAESMTTKRNIIDNILNTLYNSFDFEKRHSENVMKYSLQIAEELKLSIIQTNKLRLAALLHDIGKISVPKDILTKESTLLEHEIDEIKKHSEKGYRILTSYSELSEFGIYVLHHHEKYDGSGYPRGLVGEDIPLYSRIIAVADAFDAMLEHRVYKSAKSKQEAMDELLKYSGTQFDPIIVESFIKVLQKKDA